MTTKIALYLSHILFLSVSQFLDMILLKDGIEEDQLDHGEFFIYRSTFGQEPNV